MADNISPYRSQIRVPAVAEGPRQTNAGSGMGDGLQLLAQQVGDFVEKKARADRAAESLAARSAAIVELDTLAADLERDPDFGTAMQRFGEGAAALHARLSESLPTDGQRAEFQANWDVWKNARELSLRDTVWKREADHNRGALAASLDDFARAAARSKNEAEYASIFKAAEENISGMAAAGWISAQEATRMAQGFRASVDETAAMQLISENPRGAAKALKDHDFLSGIEPERRVRLIAAAEAEVKAAEREAAAAGREARQIARSSIDEALSVMKAGLPVDPSILKEARDAAAAGGDAGLAGRVQRVADLAIWQEAARRATPRELEEELTRLEAAASKGGADRIEKDQVTIGRSLLGTLEREAGTDPLSLAARAGKVDLQPLDPAALDPAALRGRARTAEAVAGHYETRPKYFTVAERAALTARLAEASADERMQLAATMARGFGTAAPAAFAEVAKDAPVFAHLGGLGALGPQYEAVLRDGFAGQKAIEEGADLVPSRAALDTAVARELGSALDERQAGTRAAIVETAKAIYAADALRKGRTKTDFNRNDFRTALQKAAGAVEIGGETYGGFGTWNGRDVILPPLLTQKAFRDGLRAAKDEDLPQLSASGGTPVHGDGRAFAAKELKDAYLISVGAGRYQVSLTDPEKGRELLLDGNTGGYFVLDLSDPARLPQKKGRAPYDRAGDRP